MAVIPETLAPVEVLSVLLPLTCGPETKRLLEDTMSIAVEWQQVGSDAPGVLDTIDLVQASAQSEDLIRRAKAIREVMGAIGEELALAVAGLSDSLRWQTAQHQPMLRRALLDLSVLQLTSVLHDLTNIVWQTTLLDSNLLAARTKKRDRFTPGEESDWYWVSRSMAKEIQDHIERVHANTDRDFPLQTDLASSLTSLVLCCESDALFKIRDSDYHGYRPQSVPLTSLGIGTQTGASRSWVIGKHTDPGPMRADEIQSVVTSVVEQLIRQLPRIKDQISAIFDEHELRPLAHPGRTQSSRRLFDRRR